MKTINFITPTKIILDGDVYKGYEIGSLPNKFAFIYDEVNEREGHSTWFNYKGLTFVLSDD